MHNPTKTPPRWLVQVAFTAIVYLPYLVCAQARSPLNDQTTGNRKGEPPILSAIRAEAEEGASHVKTVARVKALIAAGADVNARDTDGSTVLMMAVEADDSDCVKALIAARAVVNAKDNEGHTALEEAAGEFWWDRPHSPKDISGDVARLMALIAAGADVNTKDEFGGTALLSAAEAGSVEKVKLLIAAGADVNVQGPEGESGVLAAATSGCFGCAEALIAAGADVNRKDKDDGTTALMRVASVNYGTDDNEALPVQTKSINLNLAFLKLLLAAHANVNLRDNWGNTVLMIAVQYGSVDQLKALIASGADVNARNDRGDTALVLSKSDRISAILRSAGATK
ncbi:MAG: ankyrin repeat domain-containing protein [Candidatus Korobacteraceae bacterium]